MIDKYEDLEAESFKQQFETHASDLNDLKKDGFTSFDVLKMTIIKYEMIFNIVPEISFESTADDLKEFMNHLEESIDFWTAFVDEEKDRITKVAHKSCLKITDDLY